MRPLDDRLPLGLGLELLLLDLLRLELQDVLHRVGLAARRDDLPGGRGLGLLDLARLLGLRGQARLLDFLGLALQRDVQALGRLDLVDHRDPPLLELGRQDEVADQDLLEHDAALGQALARGHGGERRQLLALLGDQAGHLVARGHGAEGREEDRRDELARRARAEAPPTSRAAACGRSPTAPGR